MKIMNSLRALLVEVDCVVNAAILKILEGLGIFVTPSFTAEGAISVIDRGEYLKILVTDIDFGEGLNGFDVARHARDRYPDLPVVFMSETQGSRCAAEGVVGSTFVAKPFRPSEIKDAIDRACRAFGAAATT
jgi:CheY-like chemotaxis protein